MENTPQLPFGKMFRAHLVPIKEKISESSSKNSARLKEVTPLFLDLRSGTESPRGTMQDSLWETDFQSLGESLMQNFGAYPKDVEESFLWQILEDNVPDKYYLSERACQGVLRRAERRGKDLPILLRIALFTRVWDARGNGDGDIAPTITGDHNNRVTDFTALCVRERCGCEGGGKGLLVQHERAGTIATNNDQFVVVAGVDLYNQTLTNDKAATIGTNCGLATGRNAILIGESYANEIIGMATQQGGAEIGKDLYPTITAAAGTSGNNHPAFCYALDRSSFNQGMNAQFDIGIDESGIAHTLVAKGPGAVAYGVEIGDRIKLAVRRATPTECDRLQGMPDWWCEDVPHSDSAEYKMWGNGMALPNVLYVMEGVVLLLSLRMLDSIWEVAE